MFTATMSTIVKLCTCPSLEDRLQKLRCVLTMAHCEPFQYKTWGPEGETVHHDQHGKMASWGVSLFSKNNSSFRAVDGWGPLCSLRSYPSPFCPSWWHCLGFCNFALSWNQVFLLKNELVSLDMLHFFYLIFQIGHSIFFHKSMLGSWVESCWTTD